MNILSLKDFLNTYRVDKLDLPTIDSAIKQISERAEELEYEHYNSPPHVAAAQALRDDVKRLETMKANLIAGRDAIPLWTSLNHDTVAEGTLVRHAAAIWIARRLTSSEPYPGSRDWQHLFGKPINKAPAASKRATTLDFSFPQAKSMPASDRDFILKVQRRVAQCQAEHGLNDDDMKRTPTVRLLFTLVEAVKEIAAEEIQELRGRIEALELGGAKRKSTHSPRLNKSPGDGYITRALLTGDE